MKRIFMTGYNNSKGGIETFMDNLSAELSGYEIIYSRPIMELDGKVWHRPPNRHNYLRYRMFWQRFFQENQFDILYYNTCDIVSIDMLIFAKSAGIPIRIIHSHNTGIQQEIGQKMSLFHRLSEQHNRKVLDHYATHFFACSLAAGEWMFGSRPFTVIRNGINTENFAFSKEKRKKIRNLMNLSNETLVGIIGRLSPQKNPLFAVKILSSLFSRDPSAKAVFLGEGELRQDTEAAVQQEEISDNVFFMGAVDNVNEWMSAIDVLLMPSLFEGLPFVLVEAQASGLPCVVSSSVTKEANLTGLVQFVDLNANPDIWAEKIVKASLSPRSGTEQQIRLSGYSVKDTAQTIQNIFEEALHKNEIRRNNRRPK